MWQFSPIEHVRFLDGYMDAVGRVQSTDEKLVAVSARHLAEGDDPESILNVQVKSREKVENWSPELETAAEQILGLRGDRLSFYLIEYILWYREFVPGATLYNLACRSNREGILRQAIYTIEISDLPSILISMYVADKALIRPKTE